MVFNDRFIYYHAVNGDVNIFFRWLFTHVHFLAVRLLAGRLLVGRLLTDGSRTLMAQASRLPFCDISVRIDIDIQGYRTHKFKYTGFFLSRCH